MSERVCFIGIKSYGYFTNDGGSAGSGASRQVYLLSKEFARRLDTQAVVGDYGQNSVELRDGVELYKSYSPKRNSGYLNQAKKVAKLSKAMKAASADQYIYRGTIKNAFISYSITKMLGAKWNYHFAHDNDVHIDKKLEQQPIRKALFIYCLKRASCIVCQNEYQKRILQKEYGLESKMVPNGYSKGEGYVGFEDREYFLWVGRLAKNKDPLAFLDIAAVNPEKDFVLIGSKGKDKSYAQSVISKAKDIGNLNYITDVPPQDIHQYYKKSYALVSTSRGEGFPNVFLEAWRFGTPTLSLHIDPNRFISVEENLFADGDRSELENMCDLYHTKLQWEKASENIKIEFETKYQIDQIADRYITNIGIL